MSVRRLLSFCLATATFAFCALAASTPAAYAQQQDKDQQGCLNAANKSGAKVFQTQGKDVASCIKDGGNGKLIGITVDQCIGQDRKNKVAKAKQKTIDAIAKKCTVSPDFGFTSASNINTVAVAQDIEITRAVFGNPVDPAIIDGSTDKPGAKCQASVVKGYEKVAKGAFKEFLVCKKRGLKDGTIVDASGIEACIGVDPKQKVGGAISKLDATIDKKCPGVDLTTAFPGCAVGTAGDLASCAGAAAVCRVCQAANKMDGINAPCDEIDNGVVDGSCPQCGNGVTDAGEECDGGGETADCDPDCTFAKCNDGFINATAGEQCEDGNNIDTDSCRANCRNATCGDEVVCSDPSCTTGPGGGPEECDLGSANGGGLCSSDCGLPAADPQCPDRADLTLFSGTGRACTTNADCPVGTCDGGIGRCSTVTELDTGWTGIAHDADINDDYATRGRLVCPGPAPSCGDCVVVGLDPQQPADTCRCANDNRVSCDEPFSADADDCGGAVCNCYLGAPLPLSSGNTPACVVNRFSEDTTGTANVDLGAGELKVRLRSQVFLGESILQPCPFCSDGTCTAPSTGKCTAGLVGNTCTTNADCDSVPNASNDGVCTPPTAGQACSQDSDCDIIAGDGVCTLDIPKDGIRGGVCVAGRNAGASCDIAEVNSTFPAPGGGGSSLDCFPDVGKNISGEGLIIRLDASTSAQSLPATITCGFNPPAPQESCPCGICSLDTLRPCASDADCTGFGVCQKKGAGDPRANQCDDGICSDAGGGEGVCNAGPVDRFCDAVTRANGEGFISCSTNADCAEQNIGVAAGSCTLAKNRECFLDPITAAGAPDPVAPIGVALFCIPPTANTAINTVAGIPGPGRVINQTTSQPICPDGSPYTPGGSCP